MKFLSNVTLLLAPLALASQAFAVSLLLMTQTADAQEVEQLWSISSPSNTPQRSVLLTEDGAKGIVTPESPRRADRSTEALKSESKTKTAYVQEESALPRPYLARRRFEETQSVIILPDSKLKSKLSGLKPGDVIEATIPHSLIAFPDEKSPVIAKITNGDLIGENLVGEARLESNSHRIMIDFKSITKLTQTYHFKAAASGSDGNLGVVGEYHSQEAGYFAADMISSVVAAYFDGLIPRETNAFGNQVTDNSVDSAFKKGLAGGAMASAANFKEKLKRAPAFCDARGPLSVRVLVLEDGRGD